MGLGSGGKLITGFPVLYTGHRPALQDTICGARHRLIGAKDPSFQGNVVRTGGGTVHAQRPATRLELRRGLGNHAANPRDKKQTGIKTTRIAWRRLK